MAIFHGPNATAKIARLALLKKIFNYYNGLISRTGSLILEWEFHLRGWHCPLWVIFRRDCLSLVHFVNL